MRNPFRLKNSIESENLQIDNVNESIAFEESMAGSDNHDRLERAGDFKPHIVVLAGFLFLMLGGILGRLYYLTVPMHSYYSEIAQGNRLRVEYVPAPRGVIYDSQSEVLAANKPSFEVVASPLDLPKDAAQLNLKEQKVAAILRLDPQQIQTALGNEQAAAYQSVLIQQNVDREQALILQEQAANLPGFRVVNTPLRDYKDSQDFSQIIGYVGKINPQEYSAMSGAGYLYNDSLGKSGLEQVYEKYLRGSFGQRQVEVDARGVVERVFGETSPQSGDNLYLNVDGGLQKELYGALSQQMQKIGKTRGAAVAMDPRTGKILALVSMPSFDNNLFADGIDPKVYQRLLSSKDLPLFDRVIQGTYPPGSTVKPMIASAALQEGVISPQTVLDDTGFLRIRNVYGGPDSLFYGYNHSGLGPVDLRRAIALSSDIFFYIVGGGFDSAGIQGLGIDRLARYFQDYHLGSPLGIDLGGEQAGLVPTPAWKQARFPNDPLSAKWYLGDTYHVSIGQGDLLVTPLQMLSWVSTIANGGKLYQPYLVDHITDTQGSVVKQFAPNVLSTVPIDPNNLQIAREGMRAAVTEGTARSLNSLPIAVAAKTGTAQFDSRDLNRSHAWFSAFAPYDNPQIAIVVLIEDAGEGGINSVPVVRQVLDWWAKNRYNK